MDQTVQKVDADLIQTRDDWRLVVKDGSLINLLFV
jgi:hypothetical protein